MRLIDGDKLIAELTREKEYNKKQENIQREWDLIAYISQIESGRFDITSEGETARLKEHIEGIQRIIVSARDYKEWEKVRSVLISAEWACAEALGGGNSDER